MSACPKCGEPRPGGQRMHKCHTPANKATVETEESDPLVGGSEGFGMWDGPYETIEKLTAERDALRGELQAIMDAVKACYDKDNDEFMRMPPGNPGNCWEASSRHLQTFAWIRDTAQRVLTATENKKNE